MWYDVETTKDLLNFTIVADTAAQLVRESAGQPLSIGVSGSWGSGKSSLVKMIGSSLEQADSDELMVEGERRSQKTRLAEPNLAGV